MRTLSLLAASLLFISVAAIASNPHKDSTGLEQHTDTTSIAKRNHLLLGFNLTQVLVGDVELHAMYRFKKRYSIMVGAGYDFNVLDFGKTISIDDQCGTCGFESGPESHSYSRYFWGQGPSIRLILSDNYTDNAISHFFISMYSVLKYRNYDNYKYLEGRTIHCESAKQQIFGMGFYCGYEVIKKFFLFRPYGGIGFRALTSEIHRPAIPDPPYSGYLEKNYTENYFYPALDFGLLFLFGVR